MVFTLRLEARVSYSTPLGSGLVVARRLTIPTMLVPMESRLWWMGKTAVIICRGEA